MKPIQTFTSHICKAMMLCHWFSKGTGLLYILWLLVRGKETSSKSHWSTLTLESITLCEFCWQQSFQIFLLMGSYYLRSNNLMTDMFLS